MTGPTGGSDRWKTVPIASAIAKQAMLMFAEQGYDATPVRAIADAAGVTCPTIYYHFGSKQGLAQSLLIEPLAQHCAMIRALVFESLGDVERVVRLVERHFAFVLEDPDRSRFLHAVMFGPLGRELCAEVTIELRRIRAAEMEVVQKTVDAGILPPEWASDFLLCLKGQAVMHAAEILYGTHSFDDGLAQRLVERALHGFATGPPGVVAPTGSRSSDSDLDSEGTSTCPS